MSELDQILATASSLASNLTNYTGFALKGRAEELTVTADTAFGETALFDGSYSMVFEMWDAAGNYAYSDVVTFDVVEGEIWTTVYED